MIKKVTLYILFIIFILASIYFFLNKDYYQNNLVQKIENQDELPGGHFILTKSDGTTFDSEQSNKLMLIYFGFTYCPDVCPTTLIKMADVIDILGNDSDKISPIFITIDPERDSAKDINFYASRFDSSFIGLRAERPTLLSLTTQLNVAKVKPMKHEMHSIEELSNHVNNIILINKDAEYFGFFRPPFDISKLSLTYQSVVTQ